MPAASQFRQVLQLDSFQTIPVIYVPYPPGMSHDKWHPFMLSKVSDYCTALVECFTSCEFRSPKRQCPAADGAKRVSQALDSIQFYVACRISCLNDP